MNKKLRPFKEMLNILANNGIVTAGQLQSMQQATGLKITIKYVFSDILCDHKKPAATLTY